MNTPRVTVRAAGAAERDALEAFYRRQWPARWKRKLEHADGIFSAAGAESNRRGVLLIAVWDGALAGHLRCAPAPLRTGGRELDMAWLFDLVVDAGFRRRGVARSLLDAAAGRFDVIIAGGCTPDSVPLFRGYGFLDLGKLPAFVRPLRPARVALSLVGAAPRETAPGPFNERPGGSLRRVTAFGAETDSVWESARAWVGAVVPRTARELDARLNAISGAPVSRYVFSPGGRIEGQVAYQAVVGARGLHEARIIDFLTADGRPGATCLMREIVAGLRAAGFDLVRACQTCPALRGALVGSGFIRYRSIYRMMVYAGSPRETAIPDRASGWFFSLFDSDFVD